MPRSTDPRPQYFDAAGDPLVNGKMYFYESGTSTLKTTYADVNLSIANTNPVILSADGRLPNVFFEGSVRQVLTNKDDVQIWDVDPVGAGDIGANFAEWNPQVIYNTGDFVQGSDGLFYKSLQDNNLGEDPTTEAAFWAQVDFVNVWNTNVTYSINDTVRGSNGLFYRSLTNSNVGNNPTTDTVNWGSPVEVSFDPLAPYSETKVAVAASDIDLSAGNYFTKTLAANTTFTFSNALSNANSFTLRLSGADAWTVAWPASVTKWKGGAAPTLTAEDLLVFITEDAGTSWIGVYVGAVAAP